MMLRIRRLSNTLTAIIVIHVFSNIRLIILALLLCVYCSDVVAFFAPNIYFFPGEIGCHLYGCTVSTQVA